MTEEFVIELMVMTFQTMALIAAPVVIATIIVGVSVNIIQTVTQIRDPALAFIPKVAVASIVIVLATPWYIQLLRRFFMNIIELIGQGVI